MRNLTDIHNQLSAADQVYLEKHAEQIKIAEEEDAAGRIMARGFADELTKLAGPAKSPLTNTVPGSTGGFGSSSASIKAPGGTVKSGPYKTGGGATGPAKPAAPAQRTPMVPPVNPNSAANGGGGRASAVPKPKMGTGRGVRG